MKPRQEEPAARTTMASRLHRRLERRLPALTRHKSPESLPVTLSRRRIYILPTRFGLGFAAVLGVMLVGALNYANNAALLLTCLLGGIGIHAMLGAFRNLDGLVAGALHGDSAFAGESLRVRLILDAAGRERPGLRLDGYGGATVTRVETAEHGVDLHVPTLQRGWMPMPRIRIHTTWPLGLFRAWSWIHPDHALLVYPAAEASGPPARDQGMDPQMRLALDGDEPAGFREYRAGDPVHRIAWKLSARHRDLLVSERDRPDTRNARILDWEHAPGLAPEQRIARLARWVNEAHASGQPWTLQLPGQVLEPASGNEHYHRCMTALAELP